MIERREMHPIQLRSRPPPRIRPQTIGQGSPGRARVLTGDQSDQPFIVEEPVRKIHWRRRLEYDTYYGVWSRGWQGSPIPSGDPMANESPLVRSFTRVTKAS